MPTATCSRARTPTGQRPTLTTPRRKSANIAYPGGQSVSYQYDSKGRVTQESDQSGVLESYTYDADARLSEVWTALAMSWSPIPTMTWAGSPWNHSRTAPRPFIATTPTATSRRSPISPSAARIQLPHLHLQRAGRAADVDRSIRQRHVVCLRPVGPAHASHVARRADDPIQLRRRRQPDQRRRLRRYRNGDLCRQQSGPVHVGRLDAATPTTRTEIS